VQTESLSSLNLLHPKVQAIIHRKGWSELFPIQEAALKVVLETSSDLVISAPTSSGKTEAAFFPVLSTVMEQQVNSFSAVYIAPLKALINDQFERLQTLLKGTPIAVHRWHGDVDQHRKQALRNKPRGVLLITPESLESCFINYGPRVRQLFGSLEFVVIDELHAFLDSERGIHIRSLLARLTEMTGGRPRRIALSATLADPDSARVFLNEDHPETVAVVTDSAQYQRSIAIISVLKGEEPQEDNEGSFAEPLDWIAQDIEENFGQTTNLIFANNRRNVELLADRLRNLGEGGCHYHLHHGSLSRQVRLLTEMALKSEEPVNAVCTSTLELGIDIGDIQQVAQIDPPATVVALVQRVGRSGRRGNRHSKLRLYVQVETPERDASLSDLLVPRLLQAVALVQLMEQGWLEPQNPDRPHLSTQAHQVLSLLKQHGGLRTERMFPVLCQTGPFRRQTRTDFEMLLAGLKGHNLIRIDSDGYYSLSLKGEKITIRPDFYAAFASPVEMAVRHGSEEIGKLPVGIGLREDDCILLDARRWLIQEIQWKKRTIWVAPAKYAKPPVFLGSPGDVHARVHQEIKAILCGNHIPPWLDDQSAELLETARAAANNAGLSTMDVLVSESGIQWFPWAGSCALRTLAVWAELQDVKNSLDSLSITYPGISLKKFESHLAQFKDADPVALARLLPDRERQKFDQYVHADLLDRANAVDRLDLPTARDSACLAMEWISELKRLPLRPKARWATQRCASVHPSRRR
jgi:ATP-dependent Lhr-like helicase